MPPPRRTLTLWGLGHALLPHLSVLTQATFHTLGSLVGMQNTERHPHGLLSREGTFGGKRKSRQQKAGFWLGSLQPGQGRRAFPGGCAGRDQSPGGSRRSPAPGAVCEERAPLPLQGHPSLLVLRG